MREIERLREALAAVRGSAGALDRARDAAEDDDAASEEHLDALTRLADAASSYLSGDFEVTRLRARVAELEAKVTQLRSSNGALMVDADRRERRAAEHAQDCGEHGREIQYLRHCASWYWASMNVSDSARQAIVMANLNTASKCDDLGPDGTVKAAELAAWLRKNADAQKGPLKRQGYPTLADCIRGGGCDHDGLSANVKADIAKALGLAVPEVSA